MAKSSRQKRSNHSSKDAALDQSDSEEKIEIVDEEVHPVKPKKSRNGKGESSVRVSLDLHAGENRKLRDRGNGDENSAEVERSSWKRRRDGERKEKLRPEMEDTERALKEEVRNAEVKLRRAMEDTERALKEEVRNAEVKKDAKEKLRPAMEDTERALKEEVRNTEVKKECEKQIKRSIDGSVQKGKCQDYVKGDNFSRRSSRDGNVKNRRTKDGAGTKDKCGEAAERSSKDKCGEAAERSSKEKCGEAAERSSKEKCREAAERSSKEKCREVAEKSYKDKYEEAEYRRYKEKYGVAAERSSKEKHEDTTERRSTDKFVEVAERSSKDKHREAAYRSSMDKHGEGSERCSQDKLVEVAERSSKDKHREAAHKSSMDKHGEGSERSSQDKLIEAAERSSKDKHREAARRSSMDKHGEGSERSSQDKLVEAAERSSKGKSVAAAERSSKDKFVEAAQRSSRDKHGEAGEKIHDRDKYGEATKRSSEEKFVEAAVRSSKNKFVEAAERSSKDKYEEAAERIYKDKYGEAGKTNFKHKYGEAAEISSKEKILEAADQSSKHTYGEATENYKDKYEESSERGYKDKGAEAAYRSYKEKYGEDAYRSYKDKYGDDAERDRRLRDKKSKEDVDWKKLHREDRHNEEHTFRDYHDDRSGTKHARDESNAGGSHYKKSRFDITDYHEGHNQRCNDGSRKKSNDKEDQNYSRSWSTKESSDAEKKIATGGKIQSVAGEEGAHLRCVNLDFKASHNRQRSSPSSCFYPDQSRYSKEAELKSGDSEHQERVRPNILPFNKVEDVSGELEQPSLCNPTKKLIDKDDNDLCNLSCESCLNPDACASAVHLADDPKLITIDISVSSESKELGQRSGVIKDRDSSTTEDKENPHLPSVVPPAGTSPSVKADQFPSKSSPNFPPPRNCYKRVNSSSVGRVYGHSRKGVLGNARSNAPCNVRKGVPSQPSPVLNSFNHFNHGLPLDFHPIMHQFSTFPIYGARPLMDIHNVFPHHIHGADRFLTQDHTFGWHNPINDSCPPPLQGWDVNNGVPRPDSLAYGRLDWNHNREPFSGQQLETSTDAWKGPHGDVNPQFSSVTREHDPAVYAQEGDGASSLEVQNEENQCDGLVERSHEIEIGHDGESLEKELSKLPNSIAERLPQVSKIPKADDDRFWLVYLSKLDISAELTHPALYDECLKLMNVQQNEPVDEESLRLLYLEEVVETQVELPKLASGASLFVAIDDGVCERAMSFYEKQRDETRAIPLPSFSSRQKASFCSAKNMKFAPSFNQEKQAVPISPSYETNLGKLLRTCSAPYEKMDESVPIVGLEKSSESSPSGVMQEVKMDMKLVPDQEAPNDCIKDDFPTIVDQESQSPGLPSHLGRTGYFSGVHSAGSAEVQKLVDTGCNRIPYSKVSDGACECVMPRPIESGSVNVSWIQSAFKSTH